MNRKSKRAPEGGLWRRVDRRKRLFRVTSICIVVGAVLKAKFGRQVMRD